MKNKLEQMDEGTPQPVAVAERRMARRYILSASAEVSDVTSGARLAARVGDISITGCYLDSINPLPEARACAFTFAETTWSSAARERCDTRSLEWGWASRFSI